MHESDATPGATLPLKLVGAWRRVGVLIDGKRRVDELDRLWLQTHKWFADIRLRIDPVPTPSGEVQPGFLYREGAFAGIARWAEPVITWDHLIDSGGRRNVDDSSPLTWTDGVVWESGTTTIGSTEHSFVEEWVLMTDESVTWKAEASEHSARIEVGRWAIEIRDDRPRGEFSAVRYERTDSEWTRVGNLNVPASGPT